MSTKKICIFYFSGTGFTGYVAKRLARELESRQIDVDCFKMENTQAGSIDMSGYEAAGIFYPIHSFNAPRIVIKFIRQLPKTDGLSTFVVSTGGEDSKLNYASSDLLIKILNRKGYKVFYNRLVEMPSNFMVKYDDERVKRIIDKAKDDVINIAQDITEEKQYFLKKNKTAKTNVVL